MAKNKNNGEAKIVCPNFLVNTVQFSSGKVDTIVAYKEKKIWFIWTQYFQKWKNYCLYTFY